MAFSRSTLVFSIVILGVSHLLLAQQLPRHSSPETIRACYQNATALNRGTRQPMHIDNLIAIIRKLEQKSDYLWDMRRLARTIINRFQFDGMLHNPDKGLEHEYFQDSDEVTKTIIIQSLIPSSDSIPEGWLDNDERCALHWMLSHSLNATRRDDEEYERYGRYSQGLRAKRATIIPKTKQPVESGVVYTPWGDISAARVIGGIAAALEDQEIPVVYQPIAGPNSVNPNPGNNNNNNNGGTNNQFPGNNNNYNNNNYNNQWNGRKKRQASMTFQSLKGIHAATLAGDIGQAAVLNAAFYPLDSRPVPDGVWNDTICPREFVFNALPDPAADGHHEHDTWTYMTASEIRGGMDGLILATKVRDLSNQGYKLSQVLEMYYSQQGVVGESGFRSCDRTGLYSGRVDSNTLREQARSFAYYYNLRVHKVIIDDMNPQNFENLVTKAMQKLNSFNSNTKPCDSRNPSGGGGSVEIPDRDKTIKSMIKVYAIPDYSSTIPELTGQLRLIGKMAFELDVSPEGSRLGLVDGRTGSILISPNFTDNAAILACKILSERTYTATTNLVQALRVLKTELRKVRDEEARTGFNEGVGNGIVVLVFVQGTKLPENQRNDILNELNEYSNEFGDTRVIFTSSKYPKSDFDNFVLNKDDDFIPIQQGAGNLSDSSAVFLKELLAKSNGKLYYPRCDTRIYPDQSEELKLGNNFFVNPNSIQYYSVSPDYFYRSIDMRFRFTSDNGKVRVCLSRHEKFPSREKNENECRETSGTWEDPQTTRSDVEFTITKPCKGQKREGCGPVYISVSPTTFPAPGSIGFDCSIQGCDSPDQVKVTWTHYGMRCGAFKMGVSGPVVFLAAIMSILYKFNFL